MAFSVRFVASERDIADALWAAAFPPPLEGRWWYRALERSGLEDQFAFAYAVLHDGARDVGIAPIFTMNVPFSVVAPPALRAVALRLERVAPAIFKPRALFLGSPCSDEGVIGLAPGVDLAEATPPLLAALSAHARTLRADMIVCKDMGAGCEAAFAPMVRARTWFRFVSFPSTLLALRSQNKADYWSALTSSRRNKLKKKLRISAAHAELESEWTSAPDAATLDRIFALFMQTFERAEVRFEQLNRRFFEAIAQAPAASFLLLRERANGEIVAFMLCFHIGGRVINKFIGIDYRRPSTWFLYFRLWDALVDRALALGADSIQSGQTAYSAKIEIGHDLVPLVNYGRHRLRPVHWLIGAVVKRLSWESLDDDLAAWLKAHPEQAARQRPQAD